MVWGCLICLMDRWINTQSYWLPKQLSDKDLSEVSQVQGSGMHRKIRAERNQQGYCIDIQTKTTTTPFRKCCHVDFSHLCRATQLTKGELWAAVKRQLPASDFPPPECQLFYISSTMQLVDLCEFETGNHPLLTFWKAPACTTRWLAFQPHSSGGSAELHDARLEAMRSKAFLFRFHFQDLHLLLGLKPFSCDPNHTWIYPGFQHFNEWEWKNLITNSICRQVTTYPKLTSKNVDICQKKNNASIRMPHSGIFRDPKISRSWPLHSPTFTKHQGTVLSRSASSSSRSPRRASAAASSLGSRAIYGFSQGDWTVENMNQTRKWQFGTLSENI